MDQMTAGMTVLFNGGLATLGAALNWPVVFAVVSLVSLSWLARLEIDDLDMRAAKPNVIRH